MTIKLKYEFKCQSKYKYNFLFQTFPNQSGTLNKPCIIFEACIVEAGEKNSERGILPKRGKSCCSVGSESHPPIGPAWVWFITSLSMNALSY